MNLTYPKLVQKQMFLEPTPVRLCFRFVTILDPPVNRFRYARSASYNAYAISSKPKKVLVTEPWGKRVSLALNSRADCMNSRS